MITAIYVRISKEDTNSGKSMSPQMQLDNCKKYCEFKGLKNIQVFQDLDIGGRTDNRPAFQEMMALVEKKQVSDIVCYAMARFSRSRVTFLHSIPLFKKKKVVFHSIKENIDLSTPTGRLIADILSSLTEFEVEQLGERTSDNLQLRKSQLRVYGKNAPYGFTKIDGLLVPFDDEIPIVRLALSLKGKGVKTPTVANELNKLYKPRTGKMFYPKTVTDIWRNEKFYKDKEII